MLSSLQKQDWRKEDTHAITDLLALEGDLEELARVRLLLPDLDDRHAALQRLLQTLVVVLAAVKEKDTAQISSRKVCNAR